MTGNIKVKTCDESTFSMEITNFSNPQNLFPQKYLVLTTICTITGNHTTNYICMGIVYNDMLFQIRSYRLSNKLSRSLNILTELIEIIIIVTYG